MTPKTLAPQQERSRESMRKLLRAAAEILGQRGVEGATIPHIARHAGLTPGAVYRRFKDKDALLETMIIGLLERSDAHLRMALTPDMARQIPLPVLVDQIIDGMLVSYRSNASLLRAIRQFAHASKNSRFTAKVRKLETGTLHYVVDLLLVHRRRIRHPDPAMALFFAVMLLNGALMELFLVDRDPKTWLGVIPKDHQTLKTELKRVFLNYMDIEDSQ